MESIVAAAIMSETGLILTLPKPARHHTIINMAHELNYPKTCQRYQGFITDTGRFVHRDEAAKLAVSNGQLKCVMIPDILFSEDLW
jgi:hypothetical protein